jgi:hypothetical protein
MKNLRIHLSIPAFLILLFICIHPQLSSAQLKGTFHFDTSRINNWPNIHSFTYGRYGDYILMLGGRRDGLHAQESGFELKNNNSYLYLWNIITDSIIPYEPDSLQAVLYDFLNASNSNFCQDDKYLYIMGGYGESYFGNFITFPLFVRIDLENCIQSILSKRDITRSIRYIQNETFAVAGAQLRIYNSKFYLVGGHQFTGKYSAKNHSMNQAYTDALRIFSIGESADSLKYTLISSTLNDEIFHRRDYNLNPVIDPNGVIQLMVCSGVFQYNVNRAFLNTALISESGYEEIFNFEQKYANYHCGRVSLYDSLHNEMHQLFFGGMSEFYRDSVMEISHDAYVPFVKSVSEIYRNSNNQWEELLFPDELPGYLGTNAEFLINPKLHTIYENIIDIKSLQSDTNYLGCLFGGIYNPDTLRNPWQNDKAYLTKSNPYQIKVYFIPDQSVDNDDAPVDLASEIFFIPNPVNDQLRIKLPESIFSNTIKISIEDTQGRLLHQLNTTAINEHELIINTSSLKSNHYVLHFLIDEKLSVRKTLIVLGR